MNEDMIKEMEEKVMQSLYNALVVENKVSTVQGMCDIYKAISEYKENHYKKIEIATTENIDLI